jgi:hypothetical protein
MVVKGGSRISVKLGGVSGAVSADPGVDRSGGGLRREDRPAPPGGGQTDRRAGLSGSGGRPGPGVGDAGAGDGGPASEGGAAPLFRATSLPHTANRRPFPLRPPFSGPPARPKDTSPLQGNVPAMSDGHLEALVGGLGVSLRFDPGPRNRPGPRAQSDSGSR